MNRKTLLIILHLLYGSLFSQVLIYNDGSKFNSVFQNLKSGDFIGTINGVLFLQYQDKRQFAVDFQGSNAFLHILQDTNEVYDMSTKMYSGLSTSGKTKLLYSTYNNSNKIEINLPYQKYRIGSIDGCCCYVINGIEFNYFHETDYEYLVLSFNKRLNLADYNYPAIDSLTILPYSNITFIINRK